MHVRTEGKGVTIAGHDALAWLPTQMHGGNTEGRPVHARAVLMCGATVH